MRRVIYHFVLELLLYVWVCRAIKVKNGKYTDVYVVIQDNVVENEELLNNIKKHFTEASQTLFEATKHRLYFGDIKIVLPKTWSSKTEYSTTPEFVSHGVHIQISNGSNPNPFVRKAGICGKEGQFMHLTPEFLLTNGTTIWGKHANVILHEWGHLRWGLFDEYPSMKNPDTNITVNFYSADGKWNPVRCTEKVQGTAVKGNSCNDSSKCDTSNSNIALDPNCRFCADMNQDVKSSLMGSQFIDKLSSFCEVDDESTNENVRHNSKAPNHQNTRCNYRSAWEVMKEHEDLKEGVNQALSSDFDTTPDFVFLQETNSYRVFVLDISESMDVGLSSSRIETLYETAKYIIQDVLSDGSLLGIVSFGEYGTVKKEMTQITTQSDRDMLIRALPSSTSSSSTCIPCGINTAISVLKSALSDPQNGQIIVISDGDNLEGDLTEAINNAVAEKIIVHTIALSQAADLNLETIATRTGGTYYAYLEHGQTSLADVFSEVLSSGGVTNTMKPLTLLSDKTESTKEVSFKFTIDEGIGNDTIVSILLDVKANIFLQISGTGYISEKSCTSSKSLSVRLSLKTGEYSCSVNLSASANVQYYVKSSPNTIDSSSAEVHSWLPFSSIDISTGELPIVFAAVSMAHVPVINADLHAIVDTGSSSCTITLFDNGIDPDIESKDGVYSGYVTDTCIENGRLNVKVYTSANNSASLGSNTITSGGETPTVSNGIHVHPFQRTSLPGVIYITNYVFNENDTTSPGRITNLQVNDVLSEPQTGGGTRNYTIIWTATGNDKNIGQAVSYEMRISESFQNMVNNFDQETLVEFNNESLTPQIAGKLEQLTVTIDANDEYTSSAFFAIIAIDGTGNRGAVSNIISISVATNFTVIADVFVSYGSTVDTNQINQTNQKVDTTSSFVSSTAFKIILVLAAAAALACAVALIVYWRLKQRDTNYTDTECPSRLRTEPLCVDDSSYPMLNVSNVNEQKMNTSIFHEIHSVCQTVTLVFAILLNTECPPRLRTEPLCVDDSSYPMLNVSNINEQNMNTSIFHEIHSVCQTVTYSEQSVLRGSSD